MTDFKEKIDELMKKEGQIRGELILSHFEFVERKEGKEGLKRLLEVYKDLGHPIDPEEISPMGWVKVSYGTAVGILVKEIFDWTDEDIIKMGEFTPKTLTVNKFFMRHLISMDTLFKKAENYWERTCRVGNLEFTEKEENMVKLKLTGYNYHPVDCLFLTGYFKTVADLCTKGQVKVEEVKCTHNGDSSHEFVIKW